MRRLPLLLAALALLVALSAGEATAQQSFTCARRPLPDGGTLLAVRTPGAERGSLFLGFEASGLGWPERALAHERALEVALRRILEAPLADAAGVLRVDRLPGSLVIEVTADASALETLVEPLVNGLVGIGDSLEAPAAIPRRAAQSSIDLAGAEVTLGPDAWTPGARAIALALDDPNPAPPTGDGASATSLQDLHRALVRRAGAAIGIAADLDAEAALRVATGASTKLPQSSAPERPASRPLAVPLAREIRTASEEAAVGGLAVVASACRADAPDAPALLVLEEYVRSILDVFGPAPEAEGRDAGVRAASASFVPGWGQPGRVAVWLEAPAGELAALGANWLQRLEALVQPDAAIDEATLVAARDAALRRLAAPATAVDLLEREVRLALHGAPPGWRKTIRDVVAGLDAAGLSAAAMRHLSENRLVWGASTTADAAGSLAAIAEVASSKPPRSVFELAQASDREEPPQAGDERAAEIVASLMAAVGGRDAWRDVRALQVVLDVTHGERAVRATQYLDLAGPRLRIEVEGGGVTTLDGESARWTGAGGARELDAAPLQRAAHEGIARILHLLALQDGNVLLTSASSAELTISERDGSRRITLQLGDGTRPVALSRDAEESAALRFEDWTEFGTLWLPARIEQGGTTFRVMEVTLLRRFEPSWVR